MIKLLELEVYLRKEFDWKSGLLVGKIRYSRRFMKDSLLRNQETPSWFSNLSREKTTL
jgi:hypothetical protein